MKKLITITGPTASGKTSTAIKIANNLQDKNVSVVNFDSLLFYKELNIGTAKPTKEDIKDIPHYLIDIASIDSPLNAADFVKMALDKIEELMAKDQIVILVGGSAFYIRALFKGMYNDQVLDDTAEEKIENIYKENGITPIIDLLKENDPQSLKDLHINDHYRLIRAAIYFTQTGKKISLKKQELNNLDPYAFDKHIHSNWNVYFLHLDLPKQEHLEIINCRTKDMINNGLIKEVENLLSKGFSIDQRPMRSIGYKEVIQFLEGQIKNKDELIERINISTRQLAKSQRTFFKKFQNKNIYHPLEDLKAILSNTKKFINS